MRREPTRLLHGADLSAEDQAALQAAHRLAPVDYDVAAGEARLRAQLSLLALSSPTSAALPKPGSWSGLKASFLKLSGKALLVMVVGTGLMGGAAWLVRRGEDPHPRAQLQGKPVAPRTQGGVSPLPLVPVPTVRAWTAPAAPEPAQMEVTAPPVMAPVTSSLAERTAQPKAVRAPRSARGPRRIEMREVSGAEERLDTSEIAVSASTPRPAGAPQAATPAEPAGSAKLELQAIARAKELLERRPRAALEMLDELARTKPHGYFVEERRALTVMALVRLNQPALAREQAASFLRLYPNGPFSDAVRAVFGRARAR